MVEAKSDNSFDGMEASIINQRVSPTYAPQTVAWKTFPGYNISMNSFKVHSPRTSHHKIGYARTRRS
jgi:hypothetical protein